MSVTLVDSNVLLDVFTGDPTWKPWSEHALAQAAADGGLAINPIIYAEVSVRFSSIEDLDAALPSSMYERLTLPWDAAFLAGKAYQSYRGRGGKKRSPLPDFYIGAHAMVDGLTLLTRDPGRYRTAFPKIKLIEPPRA